ncbi:MAG: DUF1269 domain-containing protein [Anaerolineales bacterium]
MVTFSMLRFPTIEGAIEMETTLTDLQELHLLDIQEAAILVWSPGAKCPKTQRQHSLAEQSTLIDRFWDDFFELVLPLSRSGNTSGAAARERQGKFADCGISHEFIQETRNKVTEGCSALFLLTHNAASVKMMKALKGQTVEIIMINLSTTQVEDLQATFGI